MSDALDYLMKIRPEAMGHYFRFLKEAGRHLDPKTRSLISVITKVHAQTEAGFRQYLRRALKEGVQPIEVLDALLMAFPALGLTRIVWAVDLLLEMDLPEFKADAILAKTTAAFQHESSGAPRLDDDAIGSKTRWHAVCALDQLGVGRTIRVDVEGRSLLVHRSEKDVRVYDAHCPHQATLLSEEALEGTRLVCPKHGWEFDVLDGHVIKGNAPLREFPHRIEGTAVFASW